MIKTRFWFGSYARVLPELERDFNRVPEPIRTAITKCVMGDWGWPLTLCGSVGVGKTRAALLLADWVPDPIFIDASKFFAKWNDYRRDNRCPVKEYFGRCDILILNDVGVSAPTDARRTALTELFDLCTKPILITTNLDPTQIGQAFDARVEDRIRQGTIVIARGPSQRRMTDKEIAELRKTK